MRKGLTLEYIPHLLSSSLYSRGGLHSLGKRGEVAELCIPQTRNNISKKKLIFEQHAIVSIHINLYQNRL